MPAVKQSVSEIKLYNAPLLSPKTLDPVRSTANSREQEAAAA